MGQAVWLPVRVGTWECILRVVAEIGWHAGAQFPRVGFIVTNSKLPAGRVIKVCNGRGDVENRIKEGKKTLRWDKTSCRRLAGNQSRLLVGVLGVQPPTHASAILPGGRREFGGHVTDFFLAVRDSLTVWLNGLSI